MERFHDKPSLENGGRLIRVEFLMNGLIKSSRITARKRKWERAKYLYGWISFDPRSVTPNFSRNTKNEITFIKNYFDHENWIWHPINLQLRVGSYLPDFYDGKKGIFIEVVGPIPTAFRENIEKYVQFITCYPSLKLEFRTMDGQLYKPHLGEKYTSSLQKLGFFLRSRYSNILKSLEK